MLGVIPLLEARGWQFSFWAPRPSELFDHLHGKGYTVAGEPRQIATSLKVLRLPPGVRRRLASLPRYFASLHAFLCAQRPQLVHVNSLVALPEALFLKAGGQNVLLHAHEMSQPTVKHRISRSVAWRMDQLVAVSRASAAALSTGRRTPAIVYEAASVPPEPVTIRDQPRPFRVGSVGVLARRKGTDLLIEAARLLRERGAGIAVELVGSPTDATDAAWGARMAERAAQSGVAHLPRADVPLKLREWDAFVLPSRMDPFPIAMLEAMANGLPAIGTRVDGIAEQLEGGCGLLTEPEDPGALAEAILRVSRMSVAERGALGAAARRRVVERYTLEHQAEGLHRAYSTALGAAEAPASRA
jgi:glycosyltransferase involved in cell wall biosynthesis